MKKSDVFKLLVLGLIFINTHAFGQVGNDNIEELKPVESKEIHKYFKYLPESEKDLVNAYIKELAERNFEVEEIYIDVEKLEQFYQRDEATRTSR